MKKLITILILLISINGIGQVQKYWSYIKRYEESGYAESFKDTTKIIIQDDSITKMVFITNKNVIKFIPIYDIKKEFENMLGLRTISYSFQEQNDSISRIEFIYDSGILIRIALYRENTITTYLIQYKTFNI